MRPPRIQLIILFLLAIPLVPIPSFAVPDLPTLTFGSGAPLTTAPGGGLEAITCPSGYNFCWRIRTDIATSSTFGSFSIADRSSTDTARLLTADKNVTSTTDIVVLTGMRIDQLGFESAPSDLVIRIVDTFQPLPATTPIGTPCGTSPLCPSYGIQVGGFFQACGECTTAGDSVSLTGNTTGTTSRSGPNLGTYTATAPSSAGGLFTFANPSPARIVTPCTLTFDCINGETLDFTLRIHFGGDTFVLTNSVDACGSDNTGGGGNFDECTAFLDAQAAADRASTVPEPASLLLLSSGLAGLALWRKRRAI